MPEVDLAEDTWIGAIVATYAIFAMPPVAATVPRPAARVRTRRARRSCDGRSQPRGRAVDSPPVTRRYVIAVAVLAAGCEQLKTPKRLKELEAKVDELSSQVAALQVSGAKSKAKKPDERGGSGEAAEPGAATGSGEPPHEAEGSGEPPSDAGTIDASRQEEALARLKALSKPGGVRPDEAKKPEPPRWGYDGKLGPAAWGTLDPTWKLCQSGIAQSPIDIEPKAGTASAIAFHYKPTAAAIVDTGHTLQVNLAPGSSIEIDGHSYALTEFHFHTPSEHTIAGEHYPLEVQLVHRDEAGKLAMIGVLYDAGAESRPLDALWVKWPRKLGAEDKLRKPFDPSVLLPETRTVFRYPGSLTTPPCTEGVMWNVMRRTRSDGKASLDAFGRHYPRNAREVQPQNDRKIE
jgi:carbonic anhydrase